MGRVRCAFCGRTLPSAVALMIHLAQEHGK